MTHQTSWPGSTGECGVPQKQAGEKSAEGGGHCIENSIYVHTEPLCATHYGQSYEKWCQVQVSLLQHSDYQLSHCQVHIQLQNRHGFCDQLRQCRIDADCFRLLDKHTMGIKSVCFEK